MNPRTAIFALLSLAIAAAGTVPSAGQDQLTLNKAQHVASIEVPVEPDPSIPDPTALPVGRSENIAPVIAEARLADGTTIEFIAPDEISLAVVVGGPVEAEGVELAMRTMGSSPSPAAFYRALTGQTASDALWQQSERVLAYGNWQAGSGDGRNTESTASAPAIAQGSLTKSSLESCERLVAFGQGYLHGNWGGCTKYFRDEGQTTSWSLDDLTASASHVIGVSGSNYWDFQKRNCKYCDWSYIYQKVVPAGYHYYYYYYNNNNDFKSFSRVTSLSDGASHYHDAARCHDWRGRTVWTSTLAGGCAIGIKNDWPEGTDYLYCSQIDYHGPDPSNIYTASGWRGNGTPFWCP